MKLNLISRIMGWRPILSAPLDVPVLVFVPANSVSYVVEAVLASGRSGTRHWFPKMYASNERWSSWNGSFDRLPFSPVAWKKIRSNPKCEVDFENFGFPYAEIAVVDDNFEDFLNTPEDVA